MTVVIVLPFEGPPLTPNHRPGRHERARLTRMIRTAARAVAMSARVGAQPPCAVRAVWFPPDRRRRDAGSLTLTAKAAIDGLVDAGVWPDDDPGHVVEERYRIGAVDRENPRIELHLIPEAIDAAAPLPHVADNSPPGTNRRTPAGNGPQNDE